jgi:hypothetical protein
MTMRYLMWTALATGLMLAGGGASWASDTIRLGGPSAQDSIQGGTDTELVWWGRGWHGRGYYGRGYYGGYGRAYYGGYGYGRGYGYGGYGYGGYGYGYRPYYYGSYYRPYYYGGGSYYSPYYYGGGYGGGYGGSYYSPYYYSSYYPCSGISVPTLAFQPNGTSSNPLRSPSYMPPVTNGNGNSNSNGNGNGNGNGTYPYNGGPNNPVPLPNDGTTPMNGPRGNIPLDGKLVSLPTKATGGVSPVTLPEMQRLHYVSTTAAPVQMKTSPARISYPAYGEQSITPAPRKTSIR